MPAGSFPTRRLVPRSTVTGRSVFARIVRHGIPRTDDSSWTPPESVKTILAPASSPRFSLYESGGVVRNLPVVPNSLPSPALSAAARVRGWTGNTRGRRAARP